MGRREGSIALREEEKKVTADRPYDGTPLSQAAERDTPLDSSPGGGAKSRRGGDLYGRRERGGPCETRAGTASSAGAPVFAVGAILAVACAASVKYRKRFADS